MASLRKHASRGAAAIHAARQLHLSVRGARAPGGVVMTDNSLQMGAAILDIDSRSIRFDGAEIRLTAGESTVILLLAERLGRQLTRDELSLRLYGKLWDGRSRAVDVCVGRLRRRLMAETRGYLQVRSIYRVGYILITRR
jgi:DNA-binding response OmpR family regulator